MVNAAHEPKRRKLNLLIVYSIEPLAKQIPEDALDEATDRGARLQVADGIARRLQEILKDSGFNAAIVNMEDYPQRLRDALAVERPDFIINRVDELEGDFTEYATAVPATLALEGYPSTGAGTTSLNNAANRLTMYLLLAEADVPTPDFVAVHDINAIPTTESFSYPMIINHPLDDAYEEEGRAHPLHDREQLTLRVAEVAKDYTLPLLVEEFIDGKLVHAIVMGNRTLEVLPLVETVYWEGWAEELAAEAEAEEAAKAEAEGEGAGEARTEGEGEGEDEAEGEAAATEPTAEAKVEAPKVVEKPKPPVKKVPVETITEDIEEYVEELLDSEYLELAQLPHDTADWVRAMARRAYRALECRDAAQIDFKVTEDGQAYVIAVRPMLDIGRHSPFGVAATLAEGGYEQAVVRFAKSACERLGFDPRGVVVERPAQEPPAPVVATPAPETKPEAETEAAPESEDSEADEQAVE